MSVNKMSKQRSNLKGTASKDFGSSSKFLQQRCAYHPNQIITNFCRCQQCLLPVCPICIKLHTEEHRLNQSTPRFQINKIVEEIEQVYYTIGEMVLKVKQMLVEIEGDKKMNQNHMREKLLQHRNRLIKEFESSLIQLQNTLIAQIVDEDKKVISSLQAIDNRLTNMSNNIIKDRQNLVSQNVLKQVIIHYSKGNEHILTDQIEELRMNAQNLVKKNIIVTVDDGQLQVIRRAVNRFMKIEINNWNQKNVR